MILANIYLPVGRKHFPHNCCGGGRKWPPLLCRNGRLSNYARTKRGGARLDRAIKRADDEDDTESGTQCQASSPNPNEAEAEARAAG